MKKLMIAAAIVCAAAFAQASSVDWHAAKIYVGDGTTSQASDYACYLFTETGYSSETLAGELANGNFSNLSKAENNASAADVIATKNYNSSLKDGTYSAYMVVFNNATATDATKFYISDNADLIISGSADNVEFEKLGNRYANAWTDVVPEPTSGLLLLIGVAGLALKRKRA